MKTASRSAAETTLERSDDDAPAKNGGEI